MVADIVPRRETVIAKIPGLRERRATSASRTTTGIQHANTASPPRLAAATEPAMAQAVVSATQDSLARHATNVRRTTMGIQLASTASHPRCAAVV